MKLLLARTKLISITLGIAAAGCDDSAMQQPRPHVRAPGEHVDVESPPPDPALRHARSAPRLLPIGGSLWKAVGPAAIRDGQTENVTPDNKVAGAVHVTIPHPTNPNRMWIGTVNGGVWETRNARAEDPTWRPLTEGLPSLSIGALDLDPTDSSNRTLLAGLGNVSSYGQSGLLNGLLHTTNNGLSWRELTDPLLVGRSVTGVAARGNVLVAAATSYWGTYEAGGVMRSTNHGQTWSRVTGIPAVDVYDLASDPTNPGRLYVATKGAIYRSDDTGATWVDISSSDPQITSLLTDDGLTLCEIDVGAQGRLFTVITRYGNGAYIGYTDGGAWTAMDLPYTPESGLSPIGAAYADSYGVLVYSPGHNLFNGALVEVDGFQGMTGVRGVYIAVLLDGYPDYFYLYEAVGTGTYTGGGTWRLVNGTNPKSKSNGSPSPFGGIRRPGGQGSIHLSIAADPNDRNIVYVGGDRQDLNFNEGVLNFLGAENYSGRLFRGNTAIEPTGGILSPQWAHLTHRNNVVEWPSGGTASTSSPHADSRDLEFDALGDLIQADDGGLYRRTSPRTNTGDWYAMVGNMQVAELHNIAYDRVSRTVIGGAQDVGTPMSVPGSLLWTDYTQGDGADVSVDDTTLAAQGQSIRYTGYPGSPVYLRSIWDANGTLVTEEYPSLQPLDGTFLLGSFTTPVELNALDPTRIVIGASNGVFESLDQGETTRLVGPGITSFTNAIAYGGMRNGQLNTHVLYYGAGSTVMKRSLPGTLATPTATPFPGTQVRDIALAPRDHETAYVLAPTRVLVTRDGGTTWVDLTGNLVDASLRSVVVVQLPLGIQAVIVGGLTGVSFTWIFPGQQADPIWFELGTNLPASPVWDLDWDSVDRVLTVGTLGRGAWQATFF
jgi:photosystem II stability/assembly factor-like uncharacterized protein